MKLLHLVKVGEPETLTNPDCLLQTPQISVEEIVHYLPPNHIDITLIEGVHWQGPCYAIGEPV